MSTETRVTEDTADYVWRGDGGPVLLEQTCGACPEQYDVWIADGIKAGYLRLRSGYFTAQLAGPEGPTVYEAYPIGDGIFDEHERSTHLDAACAAIAKMTAGGLRAADLAAFRRFALDMCQITCPECQQTAYPDDLGEAVNWALAHRHSSEESEA